MHTKQDIENTIAPFRNKDGTYQEEAFTKAIILFSSHSYVSYNYETWICDNCEKTLVVFSWVNEGYDDYPYIYMFEIKKEVNK